MGRTLAVLLLFLAGPVLVPEARQSSQESAAAGQFRTGTAGVLVDVVVRDKKGRPVTGLTVGDFELLEDGVRQDIVTVTESRIVLSEESKEVARAGTSSTDAGTTARDSSEGLSFTALVFENLSPEGRALAHQAALKQLEGRRGPQEYTGVFFSDLSLLTLQPYTNDVAKLRAAIDAAASRATSRFTTEQDLNPSPTASAESGAQPAMPGGPARGPDAIVTRMIVRQQDFWTRLERAQQGHASMNALMALCASLGTLRGRKTIVFFVEELTVPAQVQDRFMRLIDVANLENVSIYTVDAAGLRVHSDQAAVGRRLEAAGVGSLEASAASPFGGGGTSDVFDIISRDPNMILNVLARETGGFLISKTNELSPGLQAIGEDRRHYYLLTYSPKNAEFKGERRRIEVRVKRKDTTVRARRSYVATPR